MKAAVWIGCLLVGSLARAEQVDTMAANCVHGPNTFNCVEYLHNYDGDTLTVNIPSVHPLIGKQITVRLHGVDAPEMASSRACEKREAVRAQVFLQKWLSGARRINLRNVQRDKYFRVLADVEIDGALMSERLLDAGLAVPYDGGTKGNVDWCK